MVVVIGRLRELMNERIMSGTNATYRGGVSTVSLSRVSPVSVGLSIVLSRS